MGATGTAPVAPIVPNALDRLPSRFPSAAAASAAAAVATFKAATAATTHGLGSRLIDHQRASFHLELVQLRDSALCFLVARHFDEPESPRPARRHVAHDACAFHGARTAEELGELGFAGLIG